MQTIFSGVLGSLKSFESFLDIEFCIRRCYWGVAADVSHFSTGHEHTQ